MNSLSDYSPILSICLISSRLWLTFSCFSQVVYIFLKVFFFYNSGEHGNTIENNNLNGMTSDSLSSEINTP